MRKDYDFSGWVTKNDIRCSDGRIIRHNAFKDCDGKRVPLVWNHVHDDPLNVLGYMILEHRDEGVYGYGTFNDTVAGQNSKELVVHGDVDRMSIWANQLKQAGSDVLHGAIREVSLVLSGANPGAIIDTVLAHSDTETEAILWYDEPLIHSDEEDEEDLNENLDEDESSEEEEEIIVDEDDDLSHSDYISVEDIWDSMSEEQKTAIDTIYSTLSDTEMKHADEEIEKAIEVWDTLTEKQKEAAYTIIGAALSENDEDNKDSDEGGEEDMKHNIFESDQDENMNVLSHSDMEEILSDAKRHGTLKESFLAHGIDNIEYLFPEAKNLDTTPQWIKREDAWVSKVMNGVHHTPFSRIKSQFADITADEARAKGYIKGNRKVEEVFSLLKRSTTPTTIYKKQKLDRDDVIDITDLDVVAWLKAEMRAMLDEEIARAILVGDGRLASSDDKINEQNIRPIWTDDDLFTIKAPVVVAANASDQDKAKAFIRACIKSRKQYKGSGSPTLYTTEDVLTDCLLIEDGIGRPLYDSEAKLATVLRVKEIVTVSSMENLSRIIDGVSVDLMGIIVNLTDYNVGADKGGAVNMFDDFDIDYNAQKYLIETRCSGALIKPFSAIALELSLSANLTVMAEDPTTSVFGTTVSDLQQNVHVSDGRIIGTLKNYTDAESSLVQTFGAGNFIALKFSVDAGATVKVGLEPSMGSGMQTLDSDMNAVLKITDNNAQKFVVQVTKGGQAMEKTFDLTGLKCR